MRDLERNQSTIWYVNYILVEGEPVYGTVMQDKIALYPYSGEIQEQTFGIDASLDMVATSSRLRLDENTFIFLSEPISNYDKTYDFIVNRKMVSLNSTSYGLKRRT